MSYYKQIIDVHKKIIKRYKMDFKLADLSFSIFSLLSKSEKHSDPLFKEKRTLTISKNKAFLILNTGRHAWD